MAEQSQNTGSDELDLGQLFNLLGKSIENMFTLFLRLFLYFKRNLAILAGLALIGVLAGFGANFIFGEELKTEVIVKPNLESKNYLYNVLEEISSNLKAQDSSFFRSIGIKEIPLDNIDVVVAPLGEITRSKEDMQYLELLEKFQNSGIVTDVLRAEILSNSPFNDKITFTYKDPINGQKFAKAIMDHINANDYYKSLIEIQQENAAERIESNTTLIKQIDSLITSYTNNLARGKSNLESGQILLENEDQVDITGLLQEKKALIKNIEEKKLEIKRREEAITVINFGNPQEVRKSFFSKYTVLFPVLFISVFLLISLYKYLDRRSSML